MGPPEPFEVHVTWKSWALPLGVYYAKSPSGRYLTFHVLPVSFSFYWAAKS